MSLRNKYLLIIACIGLLTGCESFLDSRPDIRLVVPETLDDIQAMLNHDNLHNSSGYNLISTDDMYFPDSRALTLNINDLNHYSWADFPYEVSATHIDWFLLYRNIFSVNHIINLLNNMDTPETESNRMWQSNMLGHAYFLRAYYYFDLLQIFANPYDDQTASTDLGVPIRLTDDVKVIEQRHSVQEGYDQIFSDLEKAYELLPVIETLRSKSSKLVVDAFKARIYHSMRNYNLSREYAEKVLTQYSVIPNYSQLNIGTNFPLMMDGVIFHSHHGSISFLHTSGVSVGLINPDLFNEYHQNDLRKTLYFSLGPDGLANRVRSYSGFFLGFTGLATDEMYLIVSEGLARNNQIPQAINILNTLLEPKWLPGTFEPYTASNQQEAMSIILQERRKQLVMRGQRWSDLRRLNMEPQYAVTLYRNILGETFTLPPNDPRYAIQIPPDESDLSGIQLNPR